MKSIDVRVEVGESEYNGLPFFIQNNEKIMVYYELFDVTCIVYVLCVFDRLC